MEHDWTATVGWLGVMEIDVGDDKGCEYQTVRDVGGYRDLSVRVPGGDVGRAVELTGTKKRVGVERDLTVHTDTAAVGPIVEERGTKNLVGMERKRKAREKIRIGFDVPHSTVPSAATMAQARAMKIFVRPITLVDVSGTQDNKTGVRYK
jgi:hypothetical protein